MAETTERLKSAVKDLSPSRKEIEAELSAAEVDREFAVILDQYAGRVRLKGFRAGKAPKEMVKQVYHHEIHHTLVDNLVPKIVDEVLAANQIHPASSPVIEDIDVEEGRPLKLKAVVEVWPAFVLPDYGKIKASKRDAAVADADVDRTVEDLRRKSAEYVPVDDRAVVLGDYVVIELQGKDLKTRRMRPVEKVVIIAGHEGNDKAVNDNVLGLRAGETKEFQQSYPADAPNKSLAGKEIAYRLKVVSIKAQKLPELNDDFAKTLGEYDSLAVLREKIREELLQSRRAAVRRETSEEVLTALIEQVEIELPPTVIDEETDAVLKKMAEQIPREGVSQAVADQLMAGARDQAVRNLKRLLILRRIAEQEHLSVSEEEVDAEIRAMALANGVPAPRLLDSFNEGGRRDTLKGNLLLRKAIDFVVQRAIMK